MKRRLVAVAIALACAVAATPVSARHLKKNGYEDSYSISDPRPHAWCGWWLRHQLGVADRSFNLALRWVSYGSPASRDCVNCIAVWPHHVGLVTGRPGPGTIMLKSGNDGHAVRERERSTRGIIAYRYPNGLAMR